MIKYAIAGNIASGKSTVENILKSKGCLVIDTDKIAHQFLECEEIYCTFKKFDIFEDGKISRKKLGRLVFSDFDLKRKLEKIIHPKIRNYIEDFFIKHNDEKYIFVSIPLLFEANMQDMFDKIIFVYTDDNIRLKRLMQRNGYDENYAKQRMLSQQSQETKIEKSDIIIYNNTSLEELKNQVIKIIE